MNDPKSKARTWPSWRVVVPLGAVVALVAWRVLTLALADYYATQDPERALRWRDDHPVALLRLAELRLAAGKTDAAADLARRALAADPLDGRAYRVLANVAARRGDRASRDELLALAVRHAPRDVATRAWAAQAAVERGDIAAAVRHYDRMLRIAPDTRTAVYPVLGGLATTPQGSEAIASLLADQPSWRGPWLAYFAKHAPRADDLQPLFAALRARHDLSAPESAAYLARLVREGRWEQAFLAWADELSPQQLQRLSMPTNGGFEDRAEPRGPFDWILTSRPGFEVGIRTEPGPGGNALAVEFLGRRAEFRDVRQLLLLPAGRNYGLLWRSRLERLQTARGLRWTVTCADGAPRRILATEPLAGSSGWREYRADFSVPADCAAQWLVLELEARIPAETQALGEAWFDDVHVVPAGAS